MRAHLKACAAYLGRDVRQPPQAAAQGSPSLVGNALGPDLGPEPATFDPVQQMQQRVASERLRLKLREIEAAHQEIDAREAARRRAELDAQRGQAEGAQAAAREREAERLRIEAGARSRREAEEAKQRARAHRRTVIQTVKQKVVDEWIGRFSIDPFLTAQILQAVEAALFPLPVRELPEAELVRIAAASRDRLVAEARAHDAARLAEIERQRALVRFGLDYANRELREVEDLGTLDRLRIEARVKEELQDVTGEESRAEIQAWVDEILEGEGLEPVDDD